ncbi:hypothetical protein CRG98_024571 [Punica granatum]|uniref:Uncharacterized protein n=1 Tax=Punica granatum TaxID=22663 RepID=A0A2I0JFH7_PUNGR|nr:hypothetical protein CRG98_024571 [Punica granatum]
MGHNHPLTGYHRAKIPDILLRGFSHIALEMVRPSLTKSGQKSLKRVTNAATLRYPIEKGPKPIAPYSFLSFASSSSLLARASCKSVEPARLCTLSSKLRKFAESPYSCSLQNYAGPARPCIPQVRRVTSLVLLAKLCRACSLLHPASSPSHLTRAPCKTLLSLLARARRKSIG